MDFDPKILKELIETFKMELNEQLQIITDGLLYIEKYSDDNAAMFSANIDTIFRSAHNIKGAARGIGIENVGKIAHHIESIFNDIKNKKINITPKIIDLCLEAVDSIHSAMQSYEKKTPLQFDMDSLISRLSDNDTRVETKSVTHDTNVADPTSTSLSKKELSSNIRVSLENFDQISALMEEIQVNKISINENFKKLSNINSSMQKLLHIYKQTTLNNQTDKHLIKNSAVTLDFFTELSFSMDQLHQNMGNRINELELLSNSLQNEIRTLRLIPASELLVTFPRAARDLSQELNKKINLVIHGEHVKIDKIILEGLRDPLMHLLRNSIDHGIENTETRKKLNKPEIGQIKIDIQEEGNQILFIIQDDGSGIDLNNIADIAERKNIITHSELEKMNHTEILDLIFRPGFTTKEIITDISGRGIGLDVVKDNLEKLKGSVTIKTELGKGTSFFLQLPVTLSSERGLILTCNGQLFVIPISSIEKVLILASDQIIDIASSQAIMLNNHPIPLRSLANILNIKKQEALMKEQHSIIVVKKGWQKIAFLVDEIIGEQEIVIKTLQPPLTNLKFIAGGTLSSSGQAIIVLNTSDIVYAALHNKTNSRVTVKNQMKKDTVRPRILVVDDSITTRTMEKNVLEYKNYDVTVAVNGKDAWDLLQKEKFALLITDASMPIMDGFTLTENVKKSPTLSQLPVIIVTSLDSDAEKKRGIDAGANAYVIKNEFESDKLLKIVEQLI